MKYLVTGRCDGDPFDWPYLRTKNHRAAVKALQYCQAKWPHYVWRIMPIG